MFNEIFVKIIYLWQNLFFQIFPILNEPHFDKDKVHWSTAPRLPSINSYYILITMLQTNAPNVTS